MQKEQVVSDNKKINIKGLKPKNWKQILIYILIPLTLISVMLMLNLFYERAIFFILKRIVVVVLLWCAAISDYREMRIPNKLILCGLFSRIVLLLLECVFVLDTVLYNLKSEGLALIGVIVLSVLCSLFSKGGLGMGDIKLFLIMAMFLGIEGICYSLFVSVAFSSVVAVIQLILKKKDKKDTMPFAPFILSGTIVSFILSGV